MSEIPAASGQSVPLPRARDLRTSQLAAAVRRADLRVRAGFGRAARGAHYSARADFVGALRIIAGAYDVHQETRRFTRALNTGLVALRESSDFARTGSDHSARAMTRIVAAHETTVLKEARFDDLPSTVAAQRYCRFAIRQLSVAVAGEPAGSMALFGLAKVVQVTGGEQPGRTPERTMRAVALYRAALGANGANFCAANELAVLVSGTGHLAEARNLLIHSVSVAPQAISWRNLAVVHARLGEVDLARQAQARADAMPSRGAARSSPAVQWVDPQTFSRITSGSDAALPATPLTKNSPPVSVPTQRRPTLKMTKKPIADWLPWTSRR